MALAPQMAQGMQKKGIIFTKWYQPKEPGSYLLIRNLLKARGETLSTQVRAQSITGGGASSP